MGIKGKDGYPEYSEEEFGDFTLRIEKPKDILQEKINCEIAKRANNKSVSNNILPQIFIYAGVLLFILILLILTSLRYFLW